MNLIPCTIHPNFKLSFIYLGKNKTQILCEYCLSDNTLQQNAISLSSLIHINKIFDNPEQIINNLSLDKQYQDFVRILLNSNQISIQDQLTSLEKSIQQIQEQLQTFLVDTNNHLNKVREIKQQIILDISKNQFAKTQLQQFLQVKQILSELNNQNSNNNTFSQQQVEQKLHIFFQKLQKDNPNEMKQDFIKKISVMTDEIEKDLNSIMSKLEKIKSSYENLQKDQQQIQSKFIPQVLIQNQLKSNAAVPVSKIVDQNYFLKLLTLIKQRTNKDIKNSQLIFLGSRDGLNGQAFWKQINGKSNLLMIFKSKTNYNWGAFSPCKWHQVPGDNYYQDKTNSSFLFSQTHDEIYPIKSDQNQCAICCDSNFGPVFGYAYDVLVFSNFQDGFSVLGRSYQWDQYQNQYSIRLFGAQAPCIIECEIYEIQQENN